ncbi:MAG: pyridoxamine 5'-phosphate oxidase family protein [Actinomycetota bacterium]|nr:pyridoxamine 5'-phosphate oxidase family protein [Actinomycetota bacterium]
MEARARLAAHVHGVMCTVHSERGPDPVPAVYALDDDGFVGIPIDRVKPKSSSHLQRERNIVADPRAALLVEHWDAVDWTSLWWVRAGLRREDDPSPARVNDLAARLARTVPQYAHQPFDRVLVLRVVSVTGWAAAGE